MYNPWVRKISWRREWLPTLIFWPGESHGLYSPLNSPGQNTGVGSHSLLQEIFPTQRSNPGLLHYRQILYQLSHQGSPKIGLVQLIGRLVNWFSPSGMLGPWHYNKSTVLETRCEVKRRTFFKFSSTGSLEDAGLGRNPTCQSRYWEGTTNIRREYCWMQCIKAFFFFNFLVLVIIYIINSISFTIPAARNHSTSPTPGFSNIVSACLR